MNCHSSKIPSLHPWILSSVILVLSVAGLCESKADTVDTYIKRQMDRYQIPGLSLAVVRNGKIIKAEGYGLANAELRARATRDAVYEIGSVTKAFTATAVMMLANDGTIKLDDRIATYVTGLPESWNTITIRNLLTHTSGITNCYADVDPKDWRTPYSPQKFLQSVAGSPLNSEPGTKFIYSNTGYFLLGLLIEKVSGKSYADFLKDRMFTPLNMASTQVNDLDRVLANRASGYSANSSGGLRNRDYMDPSWPFSAGALVSSAVDLARWDIALDAEQILPNTRLTEMFAPARLNDGSTVPYAGIGWGISTRPRCGRELTIFGQTPGFVAGMGRWIDRRLTVIVLANKEDVPSWDIVAGVSELYLPDLNKPIQDKTPEITKKDRNILLSLAAGTLAPALFTSGMRNELFPAKADSLSRELKAAGRMKSFVLVEEGANREEHYTYRRYQARFAKVSSRIYLELNDEQKISDFRVVFD